MNWTGKKSKKIIRRAKLDWMKVAWLGSEETSACVCTGVDCVGLGWVGLSLEKG